MSKLSLLAQAEIKKLRQAGVDVEPQQVLELHELAERVRAPRGLERHLGGFPIKVANVMLYPLTIGASCWYLEYAEPWFREDAEMSDLAIAYAHAYAKDPERLQSFVDYHDARSELKRWAAWLKCTRADLMGAVDELMSMQQPDTETGETFADKVSGWGSMLMLLCKECGGTPEHWLWHESLETAMSQIQWVHYGQPLQDGSGEALDPNHPKNIALMELTHAVNRIKAEAKAKAEAQTEEGDDARA